MTYTVRSYQPGDEAAIVELLDDVFEGWPKFDLPCSSLEHWRWKFLENPQKLTLVAVAVSDGQIVGTSGKVPRRLQIGERTVLSCVGADAATLPAFRRRGIHDKLLSLLYDVMDAAAIHFLYNASSNPILINAYKQAGHQALPFTVEDLVRIRDIDLHYEMAPSERSSLKKVGFRALTLLNRFKGRAQIRTQASHDIRITQVAEFDERIDEFWSQTSVHYELIVARDREYLNWRYCDSRGGRYAVHVAETEGGITGYTVLRINRYDEEYPVGHIVDLLALPDRLDVVHALAKSAIDHFDQEGINKIQTNALKGSSVGALFHGLGFLTNPIPLFTNYPPKYRNEVLEKLDQRYVNRMHFAYGDYDWI
jgi:GNAT superfamily N-acetyltransferase